MRRVWSLLLFLLPWASRSRGSIVLLSVASWLWASIAWAGIKTEVSARRVGVGQPIVVQVTATQEEDQPVPSDPQLRVSGDAEVEGPSVSTQSMVRMHNFSFSSEKNVIARWHVIPRSEGKISIGPATFLVGGQRVGGETVVVEVIKDAQPDPGPRRRRPDPFDVFGADPFGNDPFGNDLSDFFGRRGRRLQLPEAPIEYKVQHAPDEVAFLTVQLSRDRVVVGEPVVVTVLGYGSRGDFVEIAPTEPAFPSFLTFRAMDNPQSEPAYQLEIDGQRYVVRKLRQYVIVPLETGKLVVGGLSTVLQNNRRGYPVRGHSQGYSVVSKETTLEVTEPPKKGRPVGYALGDVGRYELVADVSPRRIHQGEFVEVTIRISGEGAIPSRVQLPERNGVVWDAPTMLGGPEVQDGKLQGTRTLKYIVQLREAGHTELGEVTLPYFDHHLRQYELAKASLGTVQVLAAAAPPQVAPSDPTLPSATSVATADAQALPMTPRARALPFAPPRQRPAGWPIGLMFAAPLGLYVGAGLWGRARQLVRTRKKSAQREDKIALKEAEMELKQGHAERALSLAERALFESIERTTGVKARGVMRHELAVVLSSHGLSAELAEEVQRCLVELETSRYGTEQRDAAGLLARVRSLIAQLPTRRGRAS